MNLLLVNMHIIPAELCLLTFLSEMFDTITKLLFTDLLVCSFLLEFPFHKYLRIWSACIRGIHFIFFPLPDSSASAKWTASCFYPPLGCSYICIQCHICTSE